MDEEQADPLVLLAALMRAGRRGSSGRGPDPRASSRGHSYPESDKQAQFDSPARSGLAETPGEDRHCPDRHSGPGTGHPGSPPGPSGLVQRGPAPGPAPATSGPEQDRPGIGGVAKNQRPRKSSYRQGDPPDH